MLDYVLLALGAAMALGGWFWRKSILTGPQTDEASKGRKKKLLWPTVLLLAGLWTLSEKLLQLIFGSVPAEEFTVDIWAERITLGGVTLSATVLITWAIVAVVGVLAVAIRLLVVPRMTDEPKGVQNVLELIVETVCSFTHSSVGDLGDCLPSYIFAIGVFMIGCAAVELLGLRAPTSDITMTFSMALVTFVLINYYGIKKKGVAGRISSMAKPTPVVFPIKVVSDLAVPVSLACRLFGNMLGGMIVMDLLYMALGNAAIGFPSVLGLYFNVFHPLIQTYIFVTLTLTFIGEATE